jgi:hypothetical protein
MKITKKIIDHDFPTREMVVLTFSETVCEPQEYVKCVSQWTSKGFSPCDVIIFHTGRSDASSRVKRFRFNLLIFTININI